jgi:HPr kinase/phosphorylase
VVKLEVWDHEAVVERTGLDIATTTILDVEIPQITIPLNPGKNITVIAEVVALNHLLRYSGVNSAEAFNERLVGRMKAAARGNVREYLQEDHE